MFAAKLLQVCELEIYVLFGLLIVFVILPLAFVCVHFVRFSVKALLSLHSRFNMAEFDVEEFLSQDYIVARLKRLVKADLKTVADKLEVDLTGCTHKADIFNAICKHIGLSTAPAALAVEALDGDSAISGDTNNQDVSQIHELDLERAKIELEERKDRLRAAEHEREMERKRLEFEMLRLQEMNAQARISMQNQRERRSDGAEFSARTKLMPKFDESDLDSFFLLFERIATKLNWPEDEWALLVQQVITGKAQLVISCFFIEY